MKIQNYVNTLQKRANNIIEKYFLEVRDYAEEELKKKMSEKKSGKKMKKNYIKKYHPKNKFYIHSATGEVPARVKDKLRMNNNISIFKDPNSGKFRINFNNKTDYLEILQQKGRKYYQFLHEKSSLNDKKNVERLKKIIKNNFIIK